MLLVLSACSSAIDENVSIEKETIADTVDVPVDVLKETRKLATIEDYAQVNTFQELNELFSLTEIDNDTAYYAEGESMYLRSIVTNSDTGHKVSYLYEAGSDSVSFIEMNHIVYTEGYELAGSQNVSSETGLYLSMPLKELLEWNGDKIVFSGFGWDYGGGVFDTKGKLATSSVKITLDIKSIPSIDQKDYYGDIQLSSDMDGILDAGIHVSQMVIYK